MIRLAVALAIVAVPGAALAQPEPAPKAPAEDAPPKPKEAAPPADKEPQPTEVRVIGSKPDSLQKIPGSGTLIGQKEIERTEPYDVAEMLRRVPGLNVRQEEGGGYRLDIGIRGLDPGRARHALILEDGIPVAVNPYAESDLYYNPPIERMRGVEVVKGSGSILFGPQTIGGVINFLTLAPPSEPAGLAEAQYGQRNFLKLRSAYGDSVGSARYVVQVMHRRGDGIRDQGFEGTDAFGKLAFETSSKGEATLKIGIHDHTSVADDIGLTRDMFAKDPRRPTLAPNNEMNLRRYEASLIHEQRFSPNTKLRTLAYAYTTARIWRRQDYLRGAVPGAQYERIVGDETLDRGAIYFRDTNTVLDRDYQVAGVEPRFEHRFETGRLGHTLDFGGRFLIETAHYEQRNGDTPTSYSGALQLEEGHRTLAFATYIQDRIAVRDDLLVTPGFRVEHAIFRREILRQVTSTGPQDVNVVGDTTSTGFIPGIGMIWGSRMRHLFGGLHVGYAPPRVANSISALGASSQVDAEKSLNYELGGRLAHKKIVRFEGTGFLSIFRNQVVAGAADTGTQPMNAGQTRNIGLEGAGTFGLGSLLRWKTEVDLGARYTFVRATFQEGPNQGNLLPYAPQHMFGATIDVDHPSGLGGQVSYQHVGSQFTDPENTIAVEATGRYGKIPSYDVIDLGVRYRHTRSGLSANLTVKNALDQIYESSRRPEGIWTGGFRQITLGVRWDFAGPKKR